MIPDYSFYLVFKNQYREQVQPHFSELFDFRHEGKLSFPSFDNKQWEDHNTSLIAPADISQEFADRYVIIRNGIHACGHITVYYHPKTHFNDCFALELWPCTSGLQFIFFSSMDFRKTLTNLLSEHGGVAGSILDTGWWVIDFWSPAKGRLNDNEPPRSTNRLLRPNRL